MAGKHSEQNAQPQGSDVAQGYIPHGTNYYDGRPHHRGGGCLKPFFILLLLSGVITVGSYFFLNPPNAEITINGQTVKVDRNTSIADVIEAGYASPAAGNLLAIDGSVAVEGGGTAFTATVNGTEATDPATVLHKGDVVEITDGTDQEETYTESEEAIPHGTIETDTSADAYWHGSLHVYQKGEDGLQTTRTGDTSGITLSERTKEPVDAGYNIYTADVGDDKVIALTFDDGPWPDTTNAILDVLEANGAKATFFTIGEQIEYYQDEIKREKALGCQVCTHTWDHASGSGQGVNLTYMSADEQIDEVKRGYEAISKVLGEEPSHVMRAPGGNYYGDLIANLEPYVDAEIGWDVDTEDWRLPGSDAIYERIMSVEPGQVILCHDGGGDRWQTVEAIRAAVPELVAQGYHLVTVDELLQY